MCLRKRMLPGMALCVLVNLSGCTDEPFLRPTATNGSGETSLRPTVGDVRTARPAVEDVSLDDSSETNEPAVPEAERDQSLAPVGAAVEQPPGTVRTVISEALTTDMDIAGEWAGFSFFWGSASLTVKRDPDSESKYLLHFVRQTDILDTEYYRSATLKDGFLTMNEPVHEFGIIGSKSPYRVLYVVRTAGGEFLVPSVNAELLTNVEQLAPGFAYRRDPPAR